MYVPHGLPAPASPAAIPGLPKATPTPPSRPTVERRAADIVVEDRPQDRCPECDETLFNVGGDDKLCLVCEWSSLPTIGGAGKDT
jgi:hypothetical protein